MRLADLRDAYDTLRLVPDFYKYCGIISFYSSATYIYLRLDILLCVTGNMATIH